ncbi:uncharacterized protein LOC101241415 [Hydra vulgaris]|uniref:uncharacterized protein LOC101241415 n=1 Tax=Hydra vulgaris TaxID=6087 RepID=UPI0002B43C61|nr:uncharacterized protein LOC101241415 [Hydra vulgaris]
MSYFFKMNYDKKVFVLSAVEIVLGSIMIVVFVLVDRSRKVNEEENYLYIIAFLPGIGGIICGLFNPLVKDFSRGCRRCLIKWRCTPRYNMFTFVVYNLIFLGIYIYIIQYKIHYWLQVNTKTCQIDKVETNCVCWINNTTYIIQGAGNCSTLSSLKSKFFGLQTFYFIQVLLFIASTVVGISALCSSEYPYMELEPEPTETYIAIPEQTFWNLFNSAEAAQKNTTTVSQYA